MAEQAGAERRRCFLFVSGDLPDVRRSAQSCPAYPARCTARPTQRGGSLGAPDLLLCCTPLYHPGPALHSQPTALSTHPSLPTPAGRHQRGGLPRSQGPAAPVRQPAHHCILQVRVGMGAAWGPLHGSARRERAAAAGQISAWLRPLPASRRAGVGSLMRLPAPGSAASWRPCGTARRPTTTPILSGPAAATSSTRRPAACWPWRESSCGSTCSDAPCCCALPTTRRGQLSWRRWRPQHAAAAGAPARATRSRRLRLRPHCNAGQRCRMGQPMATLQTGRQAALAAAKAAQQR